MTQAIMPCKLLVGFIALMLLPPSHADEYCLSGGFSADFSCEQPQHQIDTSKFYSLRELQTCLEQNQADPYTCYQDDAEEDTPGTVSFSIQLLEQKDETGLSQHQDLLHISELADHKKLVYIGSYQDKKIALAALNEAAGIWGEVHKPILVEFSATQGLPKIRLIAEPDYSNIAQATPPLNPQTSAAPQAEQPSSYLYALQMAAYNGKDEAMIFANRYQELNLLCRRKDNGLYAVYHSSYNTRDEALSNLKANTTLKKLGAYATRLTNVEFEQCNSWATVTSTDKKPTPQRSLNTLSLVFSIQTAAFNNVNGSDIFMQRYHDIKLSCRLKSNGMYAVYYGQYENYDIAKGHISDHSIFEKLGAYVVRLPNVEFDNCKEKS